MLHEVRYGEEVNLTELYLTISRARVSCSVLLYPERGTLSDISYMSEILEKLEPLCHVIRH